MDLWESLSPSHKPQSPRFCNSGVKIEEGMVGRGVQGGDKDWPKSFINHLSIKERNKHQSDDFLGYW